MVTSSIGALIRGKDPLTQRTLFFLAVINAYLSFQGLSLVEDLNGGGFIARAGTTVIAIGMSLAIFIFWSYLYEILPQLQTLRARVFALALAVTIGCPIILAASAHPNATGIAGLAALNTAIEAKIVEFERATAARYEATAHLQGLLSEITIVKDKLDSDRHAENKHGSLSGKSGSGAVRDTLARVITQFEGMQEAVRRKQVENNSLLAAAQADLSFMRAAAGKDISHGQRLKIVRGTADQLRGKFAQMDSRPLMSSIARILAAIPHEVITSSQRLSQERNLATSQKDALQRLSTQIENSTKKLMDLSASLAADDLSEMPEFAAITPMHAMWIHRDDYMSVWSISILIDLGPLLPLLFLLIGVSERSRAELTREQIANLTVKELLLCSGAMAWLRSNPLDAKTIQSLTDEQFGREKKP